jgi:CRISPR-associated protein Cst2
MNNEGTEGNVQMTRTVQIVDKAGEVHSVNAISGDMFKHTQAEYFRKMALEMKLTLCGPSARGDANRINDDDDFRQLLKANPGGKGKPAKLLGSVVTQEILRRCALTDCEGTLVVAEGYSVPRKSCVEFGWIVGRPKNTRTDSFLHVKYNPESRGKSAGEDDNSGQALFYRPASSGEYAVALHVEFDRVGRNDINHDTIPEDQRRQRMVALARSVAFTFVQPRGAQRNTQSPHVTAFRGVMATSASAIPAPAMSALDEEYGTQIESIAAELNKMDADAVRLYPFDDMATFVKHMNGIGEALSG